MTNMSASDEDVPLKETMPAPSTPKPEVAHIVHSEF